MHKHRTSKRNQLCSHLLPFAATIFHFECRIVRGRPSALDISYELSGFLHLFCLYLFFQFFLLHRFSVFLYTLLPQVSQVNSRFSCADCVACKIVACCSSWRAAVWCLPKIWLGHAFIFMHKAMCLHSALVCLTSHHRLSLPANCLPLDNRLSGSARRLNNPQTFNLPQRAYLLACVV